MSPVIPPREEPAKESPDDVSRFVTPVVLTMRADPDHSSPVGPSGDQPVPGAPEPFDDPERLQKPPEDPYRSRHIGKAEGENAPVGTSHDGPCNSEAA